MTNKTEKPVWRMSIGDGVPSDLGDSLLLSSGHLRKTRTSLAGTGDLKPYRWKMFFDGSDIIAYQTTRTRKARYERVYCDECGSSGQQLNESYDKLIKCPHCNGKGYTLEAVK